MTFGEEVTEAEETKPNSQRGGGPAVHCTLPVGFSGFELHRSERAHSRE